MSAVFFRDLHHRYPVAVRASGMRIIDETGKAYLDMSGGAAVSCLGHQHPDVVRALQNQIGEMAFAHTAFFSNRPQEELAKALTAKFGEPGARAYFTAGGSEANETALKMVWQYWKIAGQPEKTKIISRENSYHGNTFGALSVSGNADRRRNMDELLIDWPRIAACYAYRYKEEGESDADYGIRAANLLEAAILEAGPETVAAFIAEPVVGASLGVVPAAEGYFTRIREICDRYDVLLIADEIMCGTGRTGTFFAHEQLGFLPDIVTLAKGIGGGYQPLAATIARRKIVDKFALGGQGFSHGHTYVGHAACCAAGLAVVETIDKHQLLQSVRRNGDLFQQALEDAFSDHANVGDIRGRGLFRAIEFVADRDSKTPVPMGASVARQLKNVAMQQGLICYPGGSNDASGAGCHIMFAPPFILTESHIDEMADKMKRVVGEVFGD